MLFLTDHPHEHLTAAETKVLRALCLAPDHAWAHFTLAVVLICTNRVARGMAECERALALDRNLADAHEMGRERRLPLSDIILRSLSGRLS